MAAPFSNLHKIKVSILIFMIFQGVVFVTWTPLDRGELNVALSAVGVVPMSVPYTDYKVIASPCMIRSQTIGSQGASKIGGSEKNHIIFQSHVHHLVPECSYGIIDLSEEI